MPIIAVEVQIVGVQPDPTPNLTFICTAKITFDARQCPNGPNRLFADPTDTTARGGRFDLLFPSVRGGHLALTVSTQFQGKELRDQIDNLVIVGTNPAPGDVKAMMPHLTLKKIAMKESEFRQFAPVSAGGRPCPYWSTDQNGGVGVMQITNPRPNDEEVWDWRANVTRGQQIFKEKISGARRYPAGLRRDPNLHNYIELYNQRRAASGMPPIEIHLADFALGDFETNPQQLELDSIRGYNGWLGEDRQFRKPLHEYRIAFDADGYLVVDIDPSGGKGVVRWERVATSDRPANSGDPDYVRKVLSRQP
jgi:hypothetical protein